MFDQSRAASGVFNMLALRLPTTHIDYSHRINKCMIERHIHLLDVRIDGVCTEAILPWSPWLCDPIAASIIHVIDVINVG